MEKQQKALSIIADILDISVKKLTFETVIKEISDWDSYAFLTILAELDDEFKLNTPIETITKKLVNAKTIGDFFTLLGL